MKGRETLFVDRNFDLWELSYHGFIEGWLFTRPGRRPLRCLEVDEDEMYFIGYLEPQATRTPVMEAWYR